jgi:hypothetical protein
MLSRRDNIEPRHSNTCQWILRLEEYLSWISQPRGLLWIKGKPGAGKSTLMAFLHSELRESPDRNQGIRLDFFFTARGTVMQRTPLGMLRSLLNQIFYWDVRVRPQVRETYVQRCAQFGNRERKWEWPHRLLEDMLADAILVSATHKQVFVFVDALDEAGAESAQQLAGYFHKLSERAERNMALVKTCISCRHYLIVNQRGLEITVEDHNDEDIAAYIKDSLIAVSLAGDILQSIAWKNLLFELTWRAHRVFQWAHIIMPLVSRKLLDGDSPETIRLWLPKVPADLEDMYKYILYHVIEEDNRMQSFLFFQWVCFAERPLTVTEMRYALAADNAELSASPKQWQTMSDLVDTNEHMKRKIKALSGGLAETVSRGSSDETIQVVHQSVNDFFRSKGLAILGNVVNPNMLPIGSDKIFNVRRRSIEHVYFFFLHRRWQQKACKVKEKMLFSAIDQCFLMRPSIFSYMLQKLEAIVELWYRRRFVFCTNQLANGYNFNRRYGIVAQTFLAGTTLMHAATAANMVDVIEWLVITEGRIAEVDDEGNTALHAAAQWGRTAAAKILQEKGADCEARNKNGETPLLKASARGHLEFVEWLLHIGVQINTQTGKSGCALQTASLEGDEGIVKILLGAGAEINAQGGEYGNALQAASFGGSANVVRMLLDADAHVNVRST